MALSIIQTGSTVYPSAGTTPTFAPTSAVTAGNSGYLLMDFVESTSMNIGTPTDNQGNTWVLVTDGTHSGSIKNTGGITQAVIYKCESFISTGALTITQHLTPGGGGSIGGFLAFIEVSGMASSSQEDQVITGSTGGSDSTTKAFATSTSNANDLLLAFAFSDSSNIGTGHAVPSGWTQIAVSQDGTAGANGIAIYQSVSATGTYSTTMSCTNGSTGGYYMVMAALKSGNVTPTPTPTISITPTNTPTINTSATPTPTITPTVTPVIKTLTYRSLASNSDTSFAVSTIAIAAPAGMAAGDLEVIFYTSDAISPTAAPTHTTPTGWSLGSSNTGVIGTLNVRVSVFYKIAAAAEGSVTCTSSANSAQSGVRIA
ncbi:MAG: hypothetical protein JWP44_4282, partial [Mucilaginibacter sp.]|nr:hypothetical protein [Mucilaginibacter sp.]